MKKTPKHLVIQARSLRALGFSFRQIAQRIPGISPSTACNLARDVQITLRHGRGWPNRRGWWTERPDPRDGCVDPIEYHGRLLRLGRPSEHTSHEGANAPEIATQDRNRPIRDDTPRTNP